MRTLTRRGLDGKTVLLAEDEDIVVDVIREVVGPFVASLDIALDGPDALAMIMRRDYDIILLDIKMPRMNGISLFNYVRDLKPRLLERIIIITGDAESDHVRTFIKNSGCPHLAKPFKIKDLFDAMAALG
ncbi:MAG: response regulator [Deltaproteobacteria bacterium]|nr:response regulator [Deltaproteobacteria bacterium]